jgi:hypothetical protein
MLRQLKFVSASQDKRYEKRFDFSLQYHTCNTNQFSSQICKDRGGKG